MNSRRTFVLGAGSALAMNVAARRVSANDKIRIAVLGVSYKPGVGDVRESPALKIIALLGDLGAQVLYHDPHVAGLAEFSLTSTPLEEALADADLALIVTAHPEVDHELIARRARLVVDLRGVTSAAGSANVVRL